MSIARTTRTRSRGPTTLLVVAAIIIAATLAALSPGTAAASPDLPPAATGWQGREIRAPHERRPASAPDAAHARSTPIRMWTGYRSPDGSDRVRTIQRQLRDLGYRPGPVDGRYGPRTAGAVRWFQMKHGFRATRTARPAVLRHLRWRAVEPAVGRPAPPVETVRPPERRPAAPQAPGTEQVPVAPPSGTAPPVASPPEAPAAPPVASPPEAPPAAPPVASPPEAPPAAPPVASPPEPPPAAPPVASPPEAPPLGAALDLILVGLALLGVAAFVLSYRRTRARLMPTRVEVRPLRERRTTFSEGAAPGEPAERASPPGPGSREVPATTPAWSGLADDDEEAAPR